MNNLTPIVNYCRNRDNSFDSFTTAFDFVDNNFRRIINRRIPWRESGLFVERAIAKLIQVVKGGTPIVFLSDYPKAVELRQAVHKHLSRRTRWNSTVPQDGARGDLVDRTFILLSSL